MLLSFSRSGKPTDAERLRNVAVDHIYAVSGEILPPFVRRQEAGKGHRFLLGRVIGQHGRLQQVVRAAVFPGFQRHLRVSRGDDDHGVHLRRLQGGRHQKRGFNADARPALDHRIGGQHAL